MGAYVSVVAFAGAYLAGTLVAGAYLSGTLVAGAYLSGTLVAGTGRTSSSRAPCTVAMRPPAISILPPTRPPPPPDWCRPHSFMRASPLRRVCCDSVGPCVYRHRVVASLKPVRVCRGTSEVSLKWHLN